MRPVPESQDALTLLTSLGEGQMRHEVEEAAAALARLVQGIAAFSVAAVRRGITLTYVTTSWESARLDAVQYADDGPCEEAVRKAEVVATDHDGLMDEGRWLVFAQTTAAAGIRSTLSLPVLADDVVVGGINLYGRELHTCDGHDEEIARVFGAWTAGAVINADLDFSTRAEAARAPRRLEEVQTVRRAVDVLAASNAVDRQVAERQLHDAAARAGIPVVALAHMVIGQDGIEDD